MKTKFIADNGISKEKRETFEVNGLTSPDVIKILSKDHISLLNLNIGDSLRLDIAIKKMNEEKGDQTPNYLQNRAPQRCTKCCEYKLKASVTREPSFVSSQNTLSSGSQLELHDFNGGFDKKKKGKEFWLSISIGKELQSYMLTAQ